jgi:hypothetical protein
LARVDWVARCHNGKSRLTAAFSYIQSLWGLASSGRTKAYEIKDSGMSLESQAEFQYDDKALVTIEKYIAPE